MTGNGPRLSDDVIDRELDKLLSRGEDGIQIAVVSGGRVLVDAWAGSTGHAVPTPVDSRTLFPSFSVAKAVTAFAVHLQAERGLLDYDARIADYWPEFAAHDKGSVRIRHVLTHRAGMPAMPEDVTVERMCDWEWMVARLANSELVSPPGERNAYHSMTFGWLLGEVVRRSDPARRGFGEFVQQEICAPLRIDALYLGTPRDELDFVAHLHGDAGSSAPTRVQALQAIPSAVSLGPSVFNRADVLSSCIPSVGLVANAMSIATFFDVLSGRGVPGLGGQRLLAAERVESFLKPRPDYTAPDDTYGRPMPVGQGALWIEIPGIPRFATIERSRVLGHTGAGGAVAWADLDHGLAFAICHNALFSGATRDFDDLIRAAYQVAGVAVEPR